MDDAGVPKLVSLPALMKAADAYATDTATATANNALGMSAPSRHSKPVMATPDTDTLTLSNGSTRTQPGMSLRRFRQYPGRRLSCA